MKQLQNLMLWMLLLLGLSTQVQAQCSVFIFPDTSTCPITSLYASAQTGVAPYTYAWSNGTNNPYNPGLMPGTYYVTMTDGLGCISVDSFTIMNTPPIQIIPVPTTASCGQSNGAIDLTILGGSGAFQVDWYNNSGTYMGSTQDLIGVAAGSYIVYIYDIINGCFFQQGNIVVGSTGGTVSINAIQPSCNQQNGAATAVVTGFTNPTFLWSNGATTPTISPLTTGTYTVTVSDANCTATATTVLQSSSFIWAYLYGLGGCPADSLQAYVSGGQMPYTFVWSTGSSTTQMNPMDVENTSGPGIYSVTIIDANGCSTSESYTVGTAMTATYAVQNASCAGNDGAINISVTGGDGYYYYYWSNAQYTEDLSGLTPGVYDVQIYDSSQCSVFIDSIVVGGGGNAFVNGYAMPANCSNTGGFINQVVTGMTNPTYIWSTGATTPTLTNLASGWYGVTISDNTGCTLVRNYYVDIDSSCYIHVTGYVYNVSLSNTCSPSGASPAAYAMVRLQPTGTIGFTDANGFYDFGFTAPGNYSVEFVNNAGVYSVLCPTNNSIAVNNTTLGNNYGGNNFYIISPHSQDLSIYLWHYSTVTPGFPYWTVAQFCNNGQIAMSGTIDYTYDANLVFNVVMPMGYTGSPVFTGHDTSNHLLTFSFSNLYPGECGDIRIDFMTPTSLPLGTVVTNSATIYPLNNDATPANNSDVDSTTCVGSWDPNEKLAKPVRSGNDRDGGTIYTSDEVIEYTIHFQNLGTAPAYRVVVRDELDANLLIESIRNVQMSHNGTLSIENGNELVFTFNNIMLPAASFDYHGSNGYVKFTINRTAGLALGTVINNDAAIYFDFNTAVITNTNSLTIAEPTAVTTVEGVNLNAVVFPNPFQSQVTLSYDLNADSEVSIELFNALGTRVRSLQSGVSETAGKQVHQFQTTDLVPGVYFLSVETTTGRSVHKVTKF